MGQTSIHRGRKAGSVKILFGRNLRAWRKSKKLLIKEVAAELGVSVSTWCQWETGLRFPMGDYLEMLNQYIDMPVHRLFLPYPEKPDFTGKLDFTQREIKVFDI